MKLRRLQASLVALALLALAFLPLASPRASAAASGLDLASFGEPSTRCDDFFDYVNGAWIAQTPIPPDRSDWSVIQVVEQRTEERVKFALARAAADPELRRNAAVRAAADFYASGLDAATIERAGLRPLAHELAAIDRVKSQAGLAEAIARLQAERVEVGFASRVSADDRRSIRHVFVLAQGGLGLPERDFYLRDDEKFTQWRIDYVDHIARMLALAGVAEGQSAQEARAIFALEYKLARAARERALLRDPVANYNLVHRDDLPRLAPGFDWPRFLDALGVPPPIGINVRQPDFFKAFAELAKDVDLGTWRAYLRWQLLRQAAPVLPSRFELEANRFYNGTLKGTTALAPRERRVLQVMSGRTGNEPLGQALGQLYVMEAFPPDARARAEELVGNVKSALRSRIDTLEWMSEPTREAARDKLARMDVKIGYPDVARDYSALGIGRVFAENWLEANRFEARRNLAKLGRLVDRGEWFMSPHIINAYYNPSRNEIVFPAAILQPPFFDVAADDALNYGAIGMVIGHEITHGFDDYGRQYDAEGNLRDWWTREDADRYGLRAAVVEKQYADYVAVDEVKLNGKATLGENIADIGGVKIAYVAWQRALAAHPAGITDGFTPEQRFFLSFAQTWRSKTRPEQARVKAVSDAHSPPRWRVLGALRHMAEFAPAFGCASGARMVATPTERVGVW